MNRLAESKEWPTAAVTRRLIAELKPALRNARLHSERQIDQLRQSLRVYGWTTAILVDEDGRIIAGHGRVEAAKREGMTDVRSWWHQDGLTSKSGPMRWRITGYRSTRPGMRGRRPHISAKFQKLFLFREGGSRHCSYDHGTRSKVIAKCSAIRRMTGYGTEGGAALYGRIEPRSRHCSDIAACRRSAI
jgi:hypothetical protein